jgi:hypothetical protein
MHTDVILIGLFIPVFVFGLIFLAVIAIPVVTREAAAPDFIFYATAKLFLPHNTYTASVCD